jgi:hypothetical protein
MNLPSFWTMTKEPNFVGTVYTETEFVQFVNGTAETKKL